MTLALEQVLITEPPPLARIRGMPYLQHRKTLIDWSAGRVPTVSSGNSATDLSVEEDGGIVV